MKFIKAFIYEIKTNRATQALCMALFCKVIGISNGTTVLCVLLLPIIENTASIVDFLNSSTISGEWLPDKQRWEYKSERDLRLWEANLAE